jgi:hypothetical protein
MTKNGQFNFIIVNPLCVKRTQVNDLKSWNVTFESGVVQIGIPT